MPNDEASRVIQGDSECQDGHSPQKGFRGNRRSEEGGGPAMSNRNVLCRLIVYGEQSNR